MFIPIANDRLRETTFTRILRKKPAQMSIIFMAVMVCSIWPVPLPEAMSNQAIAELIGRYASVYAAGQPVN